MLSSVLDGDHPPDVNGRTVYEVLAKNMLYLGQTLAPGYKEPSELLSCFAGIRVADEVKAAGLR